MSGKRIVGVLLLCIYLFAVLSSSSFAADPEPENETVSVFADADMMQVDIEQTGDMPRPERLPLDPNKPYVALTFDDGPNHLTTPKVLDALEKYGACATFFVLGNRINDKTAPILERMVYAGCEIGNHSYDHPILSNLTSKEIGDQIYRTDSKIQSVCGVVPAVIRPPYGSANQKVLSLLTRPVIIWSVDPVDWQTRNTKKTVSHVLSRVDSGDIVLMHDIYSSTANAVEPILEELSKRGYQFVTVSELLELRGDTIEAGKKYH